MFISPDYLGINYGVDDKIAKFFVDRDPPKENLYWHGKLLYLRPSAGYIFIPLIADVLFKLGITREQILSESFVGPMERIGHISALEETNQISKEEAIQQCTELFAGKCTSRQWYIAVLQYLSGSGNSWISDLVKPFKTLHRGDVFLFAICSLRFEESIKEEIVQQWFALITTLLLLDDIEDVEDDIKSGDENAIIESGITQEGRKELEHLVTENTGKLSAVNRTMANELQRQFKEMVNESRFLQSLK